MSGNVKFNVSGEVVTGGRVHLYDIPKVIEKVSEITHIPYDDLHAARLGSAGKEVTSGDIDLAIDSSEYDIQEIADLLNTSYDWVKVSKGLNQISILVPLEKGQSKKIKGYNGYVQVDLMFGNKEWMKFAYYSAGRKSKYKGMYRTMLIMALVSAKTAFENYDDKGELIAKIGQVFNLDSGITTQFRVKLNNNKMKKISKSEWTQQYGDTEVDEIEINTPQEAAEFILGSGHKPKDLSSFEKLRDHVLTLPKDKQLIVRKIFKVKSGYDITQVPTKEE